MPAVDLTPFDLDPFMAVDHGKSAAMIEDAMALAAEIAPCIVRGDFTKGAAAKAVLRSVVLRWAERGVAPVRQRSEAVGPYTNSQTFETPSQPRGLFWPSEIQQLQDLCRADDEVRSGAFSVDTVSVQQVVHADTCSSNFGATYCSCGAILTGLFPLYGA